MANIVGAVAPILGLIQGMNAQKGQERAAKNAASESSALSGEGLSYIRDFIKPYLQATSGGAMGLAADQLRSASLYDPGTETAALTGQYDQAARDSLNSDISSVHSPIVARGLGGSSLDNSGVRDILGRRATSRAAFVTNLRVGERGRKAQAVQDALGSVAGASPNAAFGASQAFTAPASLRAGASENAYARAGQYDPTGSIMGISKGLPALIPPWMRRTRQLGAPA